MPDTIVYPTSMELPTLQKQDTTNSTSVAHSKCSAQVTL